MIVFGVTCLLAGFFLVLVVRAGVTARRWDRAARNVETLIRGAEGRRRRWWEC